MSAERTGRVLMRLVPTVLAGLELRSLFVNAAQMLAQSGHFSSLALGAPGTLLPLIVACAVLFFLRETGRGLLAVLAAGQLLGVIGASSHEHALAGSFASGTAAAAMLPLFVTAAAVLATGLVVWRLLARRLAAAHRRWSRVGSADQLQKRFAHLFLPAPGPLLAGTSGRGPPALLAL
jgi:hypothetical protein